MPRAEWGLWAKLGSALLLCALHAGLAHGARARSLDARQRGLLAWGIWWLTRPGLAAVVLLGLGVAPSTDVTTHYLPQGLAVLHGQLPQRDFDSSYGVLFPYVIAGALWVLARPESVVALAIAFEALAMRLWLRASAQALTTEARADALLLYACSPVAVWSVALAGHNHVWLSAGLALCVLMLARGTPVRVGALLALTTAAVKALSLVFAPYAVLVQPSLKRAAVLALALVFALAIVHAPFSLAGADVLHPLVHEGARATSGNLPYLLGVLGLDSQRTLHAGAFHALLLVGVLAASAWAAQRVRFAERSGAPAVHHVAVTLVFVVLMLLSKKAYASYALIFWLPACLLLAQRGLHRVDQGRVDQACFAALSVLVTIEPALWFAWLGQASLPLAFARTSIDASAGPLDGLRLAVFVAVEVALLAGYGWLLHTAVRALVPSATSARQQKEAAA